MESKTNIPDLKKQMPGLYQSKDNSEPNNTRGSIDKIEPDSLKNEQGQNRVTNDADPAVGAIEQVGKGKTPDKNNGSHNLIIEKDETTTAAELENDKTAVREDYKDENINVEPMLDIDGNELGGQG